MVAAAAVTGPAWLLVLGFTGQGSKTSGSTATTTSPTPLVATFCLVVDWVAAAILVPLIATGIPFHH